MKILRELLRVELKIKFFKNFLIKGLKMNLIQNIISSQLKFFSSGTTRLLNILAIKLRINFSWPRD